MRNHSSLPYSAGPLARVRQLHAHGITKGRMRGGDLTRPLHGVVMLPGSSLDPQSIDARIAATQLILSPGQFLSRRTAAHLLGIPVHRKDTVVDVGAMSPNSPPRRRGVRGHVLRAGTFERLPSAPSWLPTPAEVWCLLSPVASLSELISAGDYLISGANRRDEPLATTADLREAMLRFTGCHGANLRQIALPMLRTGVESPAESALRLIIVQAGMPEPVTSCPVPTQHATLHADLGYPHLKIAIEYEGAYHFETIEQARKDISRHEAMRAAGWTVILATARDLRDPRDFLSRLGQTLVPNKRH